MSDIMRSGDGADRAMNQIAREESAREAMLRRLILSFSRGHEFYSADVVKMWQSYGEYWVDRTYAFGVLQKLLPQMEQEGLLRSRLARSRTSEWGVALNDQPCRKQERSTGSA